MSRFNKEVKNFFQVGETYLVKGRCFDPSWSTIDHHGNTFLGRTNLDTFRSFVFSLYQKGHLIFTNGEEIISVYGSDVKKGVVSIMKDGMILNSNGWVPIE